MESRVHLSASTDLVHKTDRLTAGGWAPAATTVGSKAMFAGAGGGTTVDIYDARTGRWSTARLTVGLPAKAAATVGTKAMFIGGGNGFEHSDVVDIYYDATGRWSTARLSQVRQAPTATTVGSKVIIAGGLPQGTGADVYDDATGVWSTVQLSHRQPSVSTTVGHMAFFAGGYDVHGNPTEVVDVYNGRNGRWSTTTLPRPAFFDRAISVGSLAIFAGGLVPGADGNHVATDVVDIFDAATGAWSTAKLSLARFSFAAAAAGDKVLFAGGSYDLSDGIYDATDVVDVYDARTGEWSTTRLAAPRAQMGGTTVGGTAVFGAGYDPIDDEASGQQTVSALVDLFSYDDTRPSATLAAAGVTRRKSRQAYAFSVAYQDAYKVDAGTPDDGDIVVSGPGGFSAAARVVAQASGKHASTRVVTYAVSGPGDRWDASDNGTYTIHLQDDQVKDATGNAAVGRRLGAFTVDIPTASATPAPATVFEVARTIDRLTYSPSAAVRSANAGLFDDSPAGPLARVIE